jgi:hypothetical protein
LALEEDRHNTIAATTMQQINITTEILKTMEKVATESIPTLVSEPPVRAAATALSRGVGLALQTFRTTVSWNPRNGSEDGTHDTPSKDVKTRSATPTPSMLAPIAPPASTANHLMAGCEENPNEKFVAKALLKIKSAGKRSVTYDGTDTPGTNTVPEATRAEGCVPPWESAYRASDTAPSTVVPFSEPRASVNVSRTRELQASAPGSTPKLKPRHKRPAEDITSKSLAAVARFLLWLDSPMALANPLVLSSRMMLRLLSFADRLMDTDEVRDAKLLKVDETVCVGEVERDGVADTSSTEILRVAELEADRLELETTEAVTEIHDTTGDGETEIVTDSRGLEIVKLHVDVAVPDSGETDGDKDCPCSVEVTTDRLAVADIDSDGLLLRPALAAVDTEAELETPGGEVDEDVEVACCEAEEGVSRGADGVPDNDPVGLPDRVPVVEADAVSDGDADCEDVAESAELSETLCDQLDDAELLRACDIDALDVTLTLREADKDGLGVLVAVDVWLEVAREVEVVVTDVEALCDPLAVPDWLQVADDDTGAGEKEALLECDKIGKLLRVEDSEAVPLREVLCVVLSVRLGLNEELGERVSVGDDEYDSDAVGDVETDRLCDAVVDCVREAVANCVRVRAPLDRMLHDVDWEADNDVEGVSIAYWDEDCDLVVIWEEEAFCDTVCEWLRLRDGVIEAVGLDVEVFELVRVGLRVAELSWLNVCEALADRDAEDDLLDVLESVTVALSLWEGVPDCVRECVTVTEPDILDDFDWVRVMDAFWLAVSEGLNVRVIDVDLLADFEGVSVLLSLWDSETFCVDVRVTVMEPDFVEVFDWDRVVEPFWVDVWDELDERDADLDWGDVCEADGVIEGVCERESEGLFERSWLADRDCDLDNVALRVGGSDAERDCVTTKLGVAACVKVADHSDFDGVWVGVRERDLVWLADCVRDSNCEGEKVRACDADAAWVIVTDGDGVEDRLGVRSWLKVRLCVPEPEPEEERVRDEVGESVIEGVIVVSWVWVAVPDGVDGWLCEGERETDCDALVERLYVCDRLRVEIWLEEMVTEGVVTWLELCDCVLDKLGVTLCIWDDEGDMSWVGVTSCDCVESDVDALLAVDVGLRLQTWLTDCVWVIEDVWLAETDTLWLCDDACDDVTDWLSVRTWDGDKEGLALKDSVLNWLKVGVVVPVGAWLYDCDWLGVDTWLRVCDEDWLGVGLHPNFCATSWTPA